MKQYKVGDTITVKAKVIRTTNSKDMPYLVSYITDYDNDDFRRNSSFWVTESEVVEPVKPVLPKDVADELEDMKMRGASFAGYVSWFLEGSGTTYNWLVGRGVLTDDYVLVLSNAWYNGYTIEPEKKYNVFAPKSWIAGHEVENRVVAFCKKNNGNIGYYQTCKQYLGASKYQFTIEEIKKYDLENFHKELVTDDSED